MAAGSGRDGRRRMPADEEVAFAPVADHGARILLLGSMPGRASLEARRYYAHPRNAFWPIMGELVGAGPELSYEKRLERLKASGIALWDVIHRCRRRGSLDSAIVPESVVVNDFESFFRNHPRLVAVFFNGASVEQLFRRYAVPRIDPTLLPDERLRLPSTSPAHAAMSVSEKRRSWSILLRYLEL